MITLIRRLFIRDYKNVTDGRVRVRHGVLASAGGMLVNLLLFTLKLLVGILTLSMSIISDAVNNLGDFFSCIAGLIGFKMSGKPADKEHPFGHERIEYVTGMIVAFVIVGVAVALGYNSVVSLVSGESGTEYDIWTFAVLAAAIAVKLFLGYFYYALGKAIGSVALKASRIDAFNDAVATSVVMLAAIVQYFYPGLWWLDAGMSIAVACFILYSGVRMIIETASPLLGAPADKELEGRVVSDILSYGGVLGVHDVTCHAYGPTKLFMTVHIEVDGYADTFATHEIIDRIERKLGGRYGMELTVHMDPLDTKNKELPALKAKLSAILSDIYAGLSFHDMRTVDMEHRTHIIFDILIPAECKLTHTQISDSVNERLKALDPDYTVALTLDDDY